MDLDARFELRLPGELIARIDAAVGSRGRSEFVRNLIEDALPDSGAVRMVRAEKKAVKMAEKASAVSAVQASIKPRGSGGDIARERSERWAADDASYLVMIGEIGGRPTQRTVEGRLGWQGLRGDRAFRRLLTAGHIRVVGGGLEVVE